MFVLNSFYQSVANPLKEEVCFKSNCVIPSKGATRGG